MSISQLAPRRGRRRHPGTTPGQERRKWAKTTYPLATKGDGRLNRNAWHSSVVQGSHPPPTVASPSPPLSPAICLSGKRTIVQSSGDAGNGMLARAAARRSPSPKTQMLNQDDAAEGRQLKSLTRCRYRSTLRHPRRPVKETQLMKTAFLLRSVLTRFGLAAFLCKRRVPGLPTPACSCGVPWGDWPSTCF